MSAHSPTTASTSPLDPVTIAYRAYVAGRHSPVPKGRGFTCACGAQLPCPVASALLADVAADWERVNLEAETTVVHGEELDLPALAASGGGPR